MLDARAALDVFEDRVLFALMTLPNSPKTAEVGTAPYPSSGGVAMRRRFFGVMALGIV
jgi:hypothetical protein